MNTICKTLDERRRYLERVFQLARIDKLVKNQKDFALQLGIAPATLSLALKGDERYLTDNLEIKVRYYAIQNNLEEGVREMESKAETQAAKNQQGSGVFIPEETRAMFDNMAETIRIQAQLLAQFQGTGLMAGAIMQAPKNFRTEGK